MPKNSLEKKAIVDPVWDIVRLEASNAVAQDPDMAVLLFSTILNHSSLEHALIHRIATRLGHDDLPSAMIKQAFVQMSQHALQWGSMLRIDLHAVHDRDPACERYLEPLLYFKGFHAIQAHRLMNWLWENNRKDFALYLQSRVSTVFQVDIHPAVKMGQGIFLDHATGIVVGMTAVIEDDVSILQGVTLGGTGKERGDRHPKIRRGVLIGAGAKILGNIEIGKCSKVAAGSVVLKDVPCGVTVAGVPAKIVGEAGCVEPSRAMNQLL
jgi:serine O-acetyltransferase